MAEKHMPVTEHAWRTFAALGLLGIVAGAFSSWYVYGTVWAWPLPLLLFAFLAGGLLDKRRTLSR